MPLEPVTLRLDEAVDLAHAWVDATAKQRSIRALFIKGPSLHRHALRDTRTSTDVDILVEARRFDEFRAALLASGWTVRPSIFISDRTTLHSKTLLLDGWPCDVDVHAFFPGFLGDDDAVFDTLWQRRTHLEFAGRFCPVADRVSGALILALHSLRSATGQERHTAELDQLLEVSFTSTEKQELADLARTTGCTATLADVLPRMNVPVDDDADKHVDAHALREWRERVEAGSRGAYFWFYALRRARWRDKSAVVWRAFWPTDRDLLLARPDIPDQFWAKLHGRGARLGRGIRTLPRSLRAIWRHRRRA